MSLKSHKASYRILELNAWGSVREITKQTGGIDTLAALKMFECSLVRSNNVDWGNQGLFRDRRDVLHPNFDTMSRRNAFKTHRLFELRDSLHLCSTIHPPGVGWPVPQESAMPRNNYSHCGMLPFWCSVSSSPCRCRSPCSKSVILIFSVLKYVGCSPQSASPCCNFLTDCVTCLWILVLLLGGSQVLWCIC